MCNRDDTDLRDFQLEVEGAKRSGMTLNQFVEIREVWKDMERYGKVSLVENCVINGVF